MVAVKIIRVVFSSGVVLSALGLIVAASLKVQNLGAFHDALGGHGVLPAFLLDFAPLMIVGFEVFVGVTGLWMVVHHQWRTAALVSVMVYFGFALYATALTIRPPVSPVPCGCGFSSGEVESWFPLAVRNTLFVFFLLAASFLLRNRKEPFTGSALTGPAHWPAANR